MKKWFLVAILVLIGSTSFAKDVFELGKAEFYKSNYVAAQKLFLQELQKNPENYPCRYFLAHTYVYSDEISKAKEEYNRIITFSPTTALKKLAMQSMYNLNHPEIGSKVASTHSKNYDNYYDLIKLDENYVKWAAFPINVYVQNDDNSYLIKNAFNMWASAMSGGVSFKFVSDINAAQIKVFMVDKILRTYNEGFEAGTATVKAKNNIIYSATIELLKADPKTGEQFPPQILLATTLHEIGHALGIQGHSDNENDLMSAVNKSGAKTISQRDLATMKKLYGF